MTLTKGYKRSRNWKKSLQTQGKLFFEHSSLHGVKYVAESERSIAERFMWLTWIIIGVVTTTVIIVNLWEKFQTNPTITGLDTDFHNWEVPFPALTICQHVPTDNDKIREYVKSQLNRNETTADENDFFTKLSQLSLNTWTEFANTYAKQEFVNSKTNMKELVFNISNKCEDIFDICYWKSTAYKCCDIFYFAFTENGFCFTFNSKHYDKNFQGSSDKNYQFVKRFIQETDLKWSLMFQVKSKESFFSIYLLNSNEITGIDSKPQHIWDFRIDTILFSVKQTYTTEDTSQLNIKQRHCAFPNEVKIQLDDTYSYTGCTTECRMKNAMKLCSCIPFFYPIEGTNYRHCRFDEIHCISRHLAVIKSVDKCNCHLGCMHAVYEIEKLETSDQDEINSLESKFVSWPMVRYKREVLFGWVDLLVSFGGIAGLFLGFSLLSAVEIIYYFTIRVYCMSRQKDEANNSTTHPVKSIRKFNENFQLPVPVLQRQRRLSSIVLSRMTKNSVLNNRF